MQVTNSSKLQLAQSMLRSLKAKSETEAEDGKTQSGKYDTLEVGDSRANSLSQGLQVLKQAAKESAEQESEAEKQMKCMKIAMRILNGDNVTSKDRKYLAQNAPELLEHAMLFRRLNEHPKDYKSLTEDEEGENGEAVQRLSESEAAASESSASSDGSAEL